jgi:hypothetical protein
MMRVCFEIDELPWLIRLEQHETEDLFCVTYGFQVDDGLTYSQAASKLGQALMHRAACDGLIVDEAPYGDELCRNGVALADCDCC